MYNIQYISDGNGKVKSAVVPIKIWEEIISEYETNYILKSKKMTDRINEARNRKSYFTEDEVYEKLGIRF